MTKAGCAIRIGTSGWYYDHWRGRFYPEDLPKSEWLKYYTTKFDTVELNNTFYHLPREQTIKKWHKVAPADFLFAVKASRYITHIKKLKNTEEGLERFFEMVGLLKKHLGPILYQLPPMLHKNLKLLGSFLIQLPKKHKAVFEFRHKSWYSDDTYELLNKHNAGFCVHDLEGLQTPKVVTGSVIYIRFHGTSGRYAGDYTEAMLGSWSEWIRENKKDADGVYAYFNNDVLGHAVKNALELRERVR
jgi:uncharacterized protein YecE (DUF72 family)